MTTELKPPAAPMPRDEKDTFVIMNSNAFRWMVTDLLDSRAYKKGGDALRVVVWSLLMGGLSFVVLLSFVPIEEHLPLDAAACLAFGALPPLLLFPQGLEEMGPKLFSTRLLERLIGVAVVGVIATTVTVL